MKERFTEIFNDLLEEKDLSQRDLARLTGYSTSSISAWKRGDHLPKDENIKGLAKALGVSYKYLLGKEEDEEEKTLPIINTEENFNLEDLDLDFVMRIADDSMKGSGCEEGDLVFFKKQKDVEDCDLAAVKVGDQVILRQIKKIDGKTLIVADSLRYRSMILEEESDVAILGKAIYNLKALNIK